MASNERLVNIARPLVQTMRTPEEVRRGRRVDKALDNKGRVIGQTAFDASWNGNRPLMLGSYHLWIDAAGNLRKKNGKASSDTDGVIV